MSGYDYSPDDANEMLDARDRENAEICLDVIDALRARIAFLEGENAAMRLTITARNAELQSALKSYEQLFKSTERPGEI